MKVLVTGGTGYIGSHICVELIQAGHEVIVIDDFSNSKPEVLGYIKDITGKEVKFYEFNILDESKTEQVFKENKIDSVNQQLSSPEKGIPKVSLSAGVAFSDRENPGENIFEDADKALYKVKENGRNGCGFY